MEQQNDGHWTGLCLPSKSDMYLLFLHIIVTNGEVCIQTFWQRQKEFPATLNLGALSQLKCACDKPHRSSQLMVIMERAVLWRKLGFHMMLHDFDLKGIDFDLKGEILSGSLLLAAQLPSMSYNILTKGHILMKQLYLIVSNQCIYSNCIWQHQSKMSISKTYAL